jgi:hypothetical protein
MTLAEKLKQRQAGGSPIMEGRTQIETIELFEVSGLTLDAVDLLISRTSGAPFAVVTFKEFPAGFYFGGQVLTDIVLAIYEELGYSIHDPETGEIKGGKPLVVSDENIVLTPERKKSSNGRNYTSFTIA